MLQFFRLKKLNRNKSSTAVYVDVRSCFRHLLLLLLQLLLLLMMLLLLLHYCWLVLLGVFFFLPTLYGESCTSMMDVVRTLRKVPDTNAKGRS